MNTLWATPMLEVESESFYQRLCDNLGIALIAADCDLMVRIWNTAASRMFGAAAELMIGTPVTSIVPHEHRAHVESLIRKVLDTGEIEDFEFQHRNAQGAHQELVMTAAPIVAESGERIGASLCIRDITKRIALQNALNESRKMASLGQLAGAVAHHFNNVLGGVITSIDYANERHDPANDRHVLNQSARALTRAMGLVRGLLAFSEGDRRSDDLADLTETITRLADEFETIIADRNIEVVCHVSTLGVFPVSRGPITTILRNIAQNAIEAMPDGGVLRIEATAEDGRAVVRIIDTGVGLDDETKSRIFEPFWTTKGVLGEGNLPASGLGLAIALGLANMIGATISVESSPNEGSCFTVVIPPSRSS